ncbi:MAG: Tat pathway signal protein [Kiritimatiellae bacterium]|nr:Tat pathway signal protein [Kiritimatiellia bacterium]
MKGMIKAVHLPLGQHMWRSPDDTWNGKLIEDRRAPIDDEERWLIKNWDKLVRDEAVWRRLIDHSAKRGLNMVLMDVTEALSYPSHPELAIKEAWAPEKMNAEVKRLAALGIEVIPCCNFSTGHDVWLGEYHRMVSTPEYYRVCADVLKDLAEVFDHPRFIHLGYDEESAYNQRHHNYCVIRQGELWWHDFLWFVKTVEKLGARAWIYSDYCWSHKDEFLRRMPRSVMQSNWYYGNEFDPAKMEKPYYLTTYDDLDWAGFEQIPCGGNHSSDTNMADTVKYCRERMQPHLLKGFLTTIWRYMLPKYESRYVAAIDQLADAMM